jgi:hypothetical protein
MVTQQDLDRIKTVLQEVIEKGFGEVRIVVQNGHVHRILKTEDYLVNKDLKQ